MARITGSFVSAPSYSVWGSASGAPAGGGGPAKAECGMRNAELKGRVASQSDPLAAYRIDPS